MSFIAVNAKSDIQKEKVGNPSSTIKKGKITPAQNAIINAWCLPAKTGILNFPKDGRVPGRCEVKNLSIDIVNNTATVVFNKGYIVICGRLVEIEQDTTLVVSELTSDSVGYIVARFNLGALQEEEFSIRTITTMPRQDDLNENATTGIYECVLYNYEVNENKLNLERKDVRYIEDMSSLFSRIDRTDASNGSILLRCLQLPVNAVEFVTIGPYATDLPSESNVGYSYAELSSRGTYGGCDYWVTLHSYENNSIWVNTYHIDIQAWTGWERLATSKNIESIETRLTRLGFNEGSVTVSAYLSGVTLTKMGKYAILKYAGGEKAYSNFTMSMSDGFAPKESFTAYLSNTVLTSGFKFAFVKGSNIVNVSASWDRGDTVPPFQIGFEIQ